MASRPYPQFIRIDLKGQKSMNRQGVKAERKAAFKANHEDSKARGILQLCFSLCLGVLVVLTARAQVPSHSPAYAPDAFATNSAFQPVGRPVARVNGVVLTDRDLLREMLAIFPYARVHNGFPKAMEADIRDGAMKMMIFEELVYQQAKLQNMAVPPAQLAHATTEFRQQFPSPQQYQQFIQAECQGSQRVLRGKIERSLLIDKFLNLEVTNKAGVTLTEAKAYFDQHPQSFRQPESFSFQSISFLPPRNPTAAQAREARQRAEAALRQAKATKSYEEFGLLAERISEDDFRVMMGDHKAADRAKLPPAVVTALAAMQPGQVSDIIEFDAGDFTILRLNAHEPAGMQRFETIEEGLREQLKKEKAEQLRRVLAAKLSKNARIERL